MPPNNVPPPGAQANMRAAETIAHLLDEIERAVVGKRPQLELIVAGLLADGHVLLDDLPGVAKTLTARTIATAVGFRFSRIQFTPDLLPSDVTGATVLDVATGQPTFRHGPVFTQLLLADEINRAPAKTQSALLEAMQERQVTADGRSHVLPTPFLVIATQNPIESEGTYPLPEAQLDRFILATSIGYPGPEVEFELLARRVARGTDEVDIGQVLAPEVFVGIQRRLEHVEVAPALLQYVVSLVDATRRAPGLEIGASPRGGLALLKLARAMAVMRGRDYATPDDVRSIAVPALAHRVVLDSEAWARRVPAAEIIRRAVDSVPTPTWR